MLKWDESYAIGIEKIDNQHKTLFDAINKLNEALQNGNAEPQFSQTISFLEKYVIAHFRDEEACMHELQCPAEAENKKAHADFLYDFQEQAARFYAEGYSDELTFKLLTTLRDWLVKHLCSVDIQLRFCVKDKDTVQTKQTSA